MEQFVAKETFFSGVGFKKKQAAMRMNIVPRLVMQT